MEVNISLVRDVATFSVDTVATSNESVGALVCSVLAKGAVFASLSLRPLLLSLSVFFFLFFYSSTEENSSSIIWTSLIVVESLYRFPIDELLDHLPKLQLQFLHLTNHGCSIFSHLSLNMLNCLFEILIVGNVVVFWLTRFSGR